MVFARLDRTEDDEGRAIALTRRWTGQSPAIAAQMRGERRAFRKPFGAAELFERVEGRLAVADDPGGGRERRAHTQAMALGFAVTAEHRVRDRDQVVDHEDRPQAPGGDPPRKAGIVEAGVPDIEVKPTRAVAARREANRSGERGDQARPNIVIFRQQDVEQSVRGHFREDSPDADALDDGLAVAPELLEISEAHPIDSGRQPTAPAAPDETRYVEEKFAIVGHPGGSVRGR